MWFVLAAIAADPVDIAVRGICDGSAVVTLPDGTLLAAYDEDRSLHHYGPDGGDVLGSFDLAPALALSSDRELDLEGAAVVDDRIWWVGSHGLNRDGEDRPNRRHLFSTSIPQSSDLSDLSVDGGTDLVPLLRSHLPRLLTDAVMKRPPKKGGLNIEGLAAHPRGGLLVGLRSPLTSGEEGDATVLHLRRTRAGWTVRSSTTLDLDDRGVRSIEWTGDHWVLIAGRVGTKGNPALYRWRSGEDPQELQAPLASLNPEGLTRRTDGRWTVLSDDGTAERVSWHSDSGTADCKDIRLLNPQGADHPSVYARGRILDLP